MATLPPPDVSSVAGRAPRPARHVEIVVIGAGAAGCAAALEAAKAGAAVLLVDEHPVAPGLMALDAPYHFGGRATAATRNPARLVETVLANNPALAAALEHGVEVALSTVAWGAWVNGPGLGALPAPVVGLADETRSWFVSFDRLIVATGARDLNFSFEGSDQPGVMGAQGLHALLARYDAFAGRRLVILGGGPLAVATAELALARGVAVAAMVEARDAAQAPAAALARLAAAGVEIVAGHAPLRATGGSDGVTGLVLAAADGRGPTRAIACDTVCLAVGAVPMIELLDVLGAARKLDPARGGHVPVVGPGGAASAPGVHAAGDCAGLGGDAAREGRAAALAALAALGRAAPAPAAPSAPRAPSDALAYQLDWMRALLATGGRDAPVCLCEDVTRGDLLAVAPPRYLDWTSNARGARDLRAMARAGRLDQDQMKRLTRVCMGACQARRCREQVALTMALGADVAPATIPLAGYRAPVRQLPLSVLAADETPGDEGAWNVWFNIATQWIAYDDIGTEREAEALREGMPY